LLINEKKCVYAYSVESGHNTDSGATPEEILENAKGSKLDAYFKKNKAEKEYEIANPVNPANPLTTARAQSLLYHEFPHHFVWQDKKAEWSLRQQRTPSVG
jgi:hypothetical protein